MTDFGGDAELFSPEEPLGPSTVTSGISSERCLLDARSSTELTLDFWVGLDDDFESEPIPFVEISADLRFPLVP